MPNGSPRDPMQQRGAPDAPRQPETRPTRPTATASCQPTPDPPGCTLHAHARDKSLYMSWLADAYLAAGEVEQAAATVGRALELSNGVASVRPRERLSPAIQQLRAHPELQVVRDVLELAGP